MNKVEEASVFFRENEGYNRLFKGIKVKFISLGEIKGNVIIYNPSPIEKQALSGLMKKDYSKNTSITINLKKLQQILDNSKFEGIELSELVKCYFKEDIITKKEGMQKYQTDLDDFYNKILKQNEDTYIYSYLKRSFENKDKLFIEIKKYYSKYSDNVNIFERELMYACNGINNLPKDRYNMYFKNDKMIRIPVFASKITSNPHGFDKKTLAGKLFILLLCYVNNVDYPRNSEELSELYYNNNLLIDDISSMVLCRNIEGFVKVEEEINSNGSAIKYKEHEGLKGFHSKNEPIFLTLYNLNNISFISDCNKYKKIVIVENPAVFMEIIIKCKVIDFPLVCTYGQVKLAGIMLLDMLVKSKYKLYYSGDIDPEGIQIADRLKKRYNDNIELFGFNKEIYYKNLSNIDLSEARLGKLNSISDYELVQLSKEVMKKKKASYEEENIDYIVEFIESLAENNK